MKNSLSGNWFVVPLILCTIFSLLACGTGDDYEYETTSGQSSALVTSSSQPRSESTYVPKPYVPGIFYTSIYDGPKPTKFYENPKFAEMARQGLIDPLEDRLPVQEDILVLPPSDEIGVYGGTWRLTLSGWMLDLQQYANASCFKKDSNGKDIIPYLCKGLEFSDDGREFIFTLREGMKWPDGHPLTMADVVYTFQDLNFHPDKEMSLNNIHPLYKDPVTGDRVKFDALDETRFKLSFDNPYYSFADSTGNSRGSRCVTWSFFCPKHYGMKYHPKYADKGDMDRLIEAIPMLEDAEKPWVHVFRKYHSLFDEEGQNFPWLGAYSCPCEGTSESDRLRVVANPYWIAVDPDGNQLPYLDDILALGVESREVAVFRAIAGESDATTKTFHLGELPLYAYNMEEGDYSIYKWSNVGGMDLSLGLNQTWNEDPELGRWLRTKEFRRALSLAIDRDALNETTMMGLGVPRNNIPHPAHPYYPGDEYETLDIQHDPVKANEILDSLGLLDTDGDGLRNRLGDIDGKKGNLELFAEVPIGGHEQNRYVPFAELVQSDLSKIGLRMEWNQTERMSDHIRENLTYINFGGGANVSNPWACGPSCATTYPGAHWSAIGPLIGEYIATEGKCNRRRWECMDMDGPDSKWLPLSPEGTWPADSTGKFKEMMGIRMGGFAYPATHPERIDKGQKLAAMTAEEKYYLGMVGFAGSFWGVMLKRNNFRNIPKEHTNATVGFFSELYYFEDGMDNFHNRGNRSKKYKSQSFLTGYQ